MTNRMALDLSFKAKSRSVDFSSLSFVTGNNNEITPEGSSISRIATRTSAVFSRGSGSYFDASDLSCQMYYKKSLQTSRV